MDLIFVNYNSSKLLYECLSSINKSPNGFAYNIFVFDNGSQDPVHVIKHDFPAVSLIENESNVGFSKAVNQIIKCTSNPYIVLLNPDTVINPCFFDRMKSFMDSNKDVGIAGPKIFNSNGSIQGSGRAFPTFYSAFFGRSSWVSKFFPRNRFTLNFLLSNNSDGKTPMEVGWISGACMVVRRKALEKVGLLDERFFLYWEDVDWCRRMWDNGWKVVYYPGASIQHQVGGSSDQNIWRTTYEFHKSAYRYFTKYENPSSLFLKMTIFFGLSCRFTWILGIRLVKRLFLRFKKKFKADDPLKLNMNKILKADDQMK